MKQYIKYMMLSCLTCLVITQSNFANRGISLNPSLENRALESNQPLTVDDIFAGMSQDEIIKQVQEVEEFFKTLSPEDQEALIKMADEAFAQMPQEEQESIMGIANMIDPYVAKSEQEELQPAATSTTMDAKIVPVVETDEIKALRNTIMSINQNVEDILQKAESCKETAEYINNKWDKRITFNNLKRQILKLNDNRLLKKLTEKNSKHADLHQKLTKHLEDFQKDISKANNNLQIEDTFGISDSNKVEQGYLRQLKNITTMFEEYIASLMPTVENFFSIHDPEALEMAKEYENKTKKAQTFSQDATVKRGSAPAVPTSPKPTGSQGAGTYHGGYPSYQEPAYNYAGSSSYPSSASSMNQGFGQPTSSSPAASPSASSSPASSKPADKPGQKTKPEDKAKTADKADKKDGKSDFQKLQSKLDDHILSFNDQQTKETNKFFKDVLAKYPSATVPKQPGNSGAELDWIYSRDIFKDHGLKDYTDKVQKELSSNISPEINATKKLLEDITNNLSSLSKSEVSSLIQSPAMNKIKTRINTYKTEYDNAKKKINEHYKKNANDGTHAAPAQGLHDPQVIMNYNDLHNNFTTELQNKIDTPLNEISAMMGRINRHLNKAR